MRDLQAYNHPNHLPVPPLPGERPGKYYPPPFIRNEEGELYVDTHYDNEVTGRPIYVPTESENSRRLPGDKSMVWSSDLDVRDQKERERLEKEEQEGRGSQAVKEARECAMQ